jgi:hypothetical protein
MDPEDVDRLLRVGEVTRGALNNPSDFESIADLCREGFALHLFSHTAKRHCLLVGREHATCFATGMEKAALTRAAAFLGVFVERRLSLYSGGVLCKQFVPKGCQENATARSQPLSKLPDPVDDDFTVVEWTPDAPHYDRFPYLILLVQAEKPRVYTVLPMDPILLSREDTAFETARIFSVYSSIDICLVLGLEKCVYIHKDGKNKRSRQRPTGGAVAHRSVTGPHLYSLHLDPLKATLQDRPDAFQWHDEFDSDPDLFTNSDLSPVEPVISLSTEILSAVRDQVYHVLQDFLPMIRREWDGDRSVIMETTVAWVKALDIPDRIRIIGKEDLPDMSSHPLHPAQYFASPLHTILDAALDVMELDLKRAGICEFVNDLLQPVYAASHIGYFRLLLQSARLAGPPDNETFWNRLQGQVFPAAVCSPVTLLRLAVWRRIEHFYRGFVPASDADRGSYVQVRQILAALPLLMKVNERGPMWMWQTGESICVMPAVVVRLDEEGELHCEDGPAIIDPDGTKIFAIHGEEQ